MAKAKTCFGFGVEPSKTQNHFYVVIFSRQENKPYVEIYERYKWTQNDDKTDNEPQFAYGQVLSKGDILKLRISKKKWDAVVKEMTAEFNARLRENKKPIGKFTSGGNPVEKMTGKEMLVLLWAIQDCDPSNIPTAISNWKGLRPEERWWLYTMTNASTGGIDDNNRGWRVALRYALCDNPILEKKPEESEETE